MNSNSFVQAHVSNSSIAEASVEYIYSQSDVLLVNRIHTIDKPILPLESPSIDWCYSVVLKLKKPVMFMKTWNDINITVGPAPMDKTRQLLYI